jgi:hypothetical protein
MVGGGLLTRHDMRLRGRAHGPPVRRQSSQAFTARRRIADLVEVTAGLAHRVLSPGGEIFYRFDRPGELSAR